MVSSCKGVCDPPIHESCYFVMDEDFSPSLHIHDQSERELCGNEVYLVILHRVSLAGRRKMKERKKKRKRRKSRKSGFLTHYGETRQQRFRALWRSVASLSERDVG